MAATDATKILSQLKTLQKQELSIIRLSEPISVSNAPNIPNRESDVSADAFENPSPAGLANDLEHYKVRCSSLFPLRVSESSSSATSFCKRH